MNEDITVEDEMSSDTHVQECLNAIREFNSYPYDYFPDEPVDTSLSDAYYKAGYSNDPEE